MTANRKNTARNNAVATLEAKAKDIAAAIVQSDTANKAAADTVTAARVSQLANIWAAAQGCVPLDNTNWETVRDDIHAALVAKGYAEKSIPVKLSTYKMVLFTMTSTKADRAPLEGETFHEYRVRHTLVTKPDTSNSGAKNTTKKTAKAAPPAKLDPVAMLAEVSTRMDDAATAAGVKAWAAELLIDSRKPDSPEAIAFRDRVIWCFSNDDAFGALCDLVDEEFDKAHVKPVEEKKRARR